MADLHNVETLISMLNEKLMEAKSPLLSKDECVIPRDEFMDLLKELYAALPSELKQAQELLKQRNEFIEETNKKARAIREKTEAECAQLRKQAEEECRKKVSASEITANARTNAHKIVRQARSQSLEIVQAADKYVENLLGRTEKELSGNADDLHRRFEEFRVLSRKNEQEIKKHIQNPTEQVSPK